jgi:biotin-dependent carboxylase-like uncharacterized protein
VTARSLTIVHAGPLTTVQDLGRVGVGRWGVARSGAFDRGAHAIANAAVGNDPDAAALEITVGPCIVRAEGGDVALAWSSPEHHGTVLLHAGEVHRIDALATAMRTSLAADGGIDVPRVLGSRSHDQLASIGPPVLRNGDVLLLGAPTSTRRPTSLSRAGAVCRVMPGPHVDRLAGGLRALLRSSWVVTPSSNRIGLRLGGTALVVDAVGLTSEPTPPAAVQVPPDGQPIVLGPDAGRTGGYPVVAVVVDEDRDLLAQLRPGAELRFAPMTDAIVDGMGPP